MKNLLLTLFFVLPCAAFAADRPNILWIVSEDNSAHYMALYGDEHCRTPNIDALAARGNAFMFAHANGPVCAVARSTLLTGAYAVTLGSHNMRSRYPAPPKFRAYPEYFREAGYYCTNNAKTDYNMKMDDRSVWDESSPKAHYNRRKDKAQPFLAVFNIGITHESCLFEAKISSARKSGLIPEFPSTPLEKIKVPSYLPGEKPVVEDIAAYYDYINAMDRRVGEFLDELEKSGEAENTIVFYYSDHGGILPREKRNLQDTGTHVPLVIYIPEKWRHLNPFADEKKVVSRRVSFVDFAPTLLSLIGVEAPAQMQGRAFLGSKLAPQEEYVFAFSSRFGERTYFARAVIENRFRYVRQFYAFEAPLIWCEYAMGLASWRAWDAAFRENRLSPNSAYWWVPQGSHFLYETPKDPYETDNLARSPECAATLKKMQSALKEKMIETRDLGIIPEFKYEDILEISASLHDFARSEGFDYAAVLEAAWLASEEDASKISELKKYLESENCYLRYWGAVGLLNLKTKDVEGAVAKLLKDDEAMNRALAQLLIAYNLGKRAEASAGLEKLLDFAPDKLSNTLREFIITKMQDLGADSEHVTELRRKDAETREKSKRLYTAR